MLYNIVMAFAIHQHESAIGIYVFWKIVPMTLKQRWDKCLCMCMYHRNMSFQTHGNTHHLSLPYCEMLFKCCVVSVHFLSPELLPQNCPVNELPKLSLKFRPTHCSSIALGPFIVKQWGCKLWKQFLENSKQTPPWDQTGM